MVRGKKKVLSIAIGIIICLAFAGAVSAYEMIFDESNSGFSTTGAWLNSSNSCGYNGGYLYETDLLATNTARWNLSIAVAGNYSVYAHYCVHSARPSAVPFAIRHSKGISYTFVDETKNASGDFPGDFNASGWKLLGTYYFNLTTTTPNQFVRLNTSDAGDTSADAVRLVLIASSPNIDFTSPTPLSGSTNNPLLEVNASATSPYFTNMTMDLYNSLGSLINSTFSTLSNLFLQYVLADGVYYFNATAYTLAGDYNSTATRNILIDTVSPIIAISSPVNNSQRITNNFAVRYTVSDLTLNSCWWTQDNGVVNTTIACGTNITGQIWSQNRTEVVIYSNDSFNNLASDSVVFFVDSIKPQLNILSPANSSSFNLNNLEINYSAFDANLNLCKWTRNNGAVNTTIACGANITGQTWSEGLNTVKIFVEDSFGNKNSTSVSFYIDTLSPVLEVFSPANGSLFNSADAEINYSASDANLQSCWWTQNNGVVNTTIACGANITGQTWGQGRTDIQIYANDSLGNTGSAELFFYVDTNYPGIISASMDKCYYNGSDINFAAIINESSLNSAILQATFEGLWKNYSLSCINLTSSNDYYSCSYKIDASLLSSDIVNGTFDWSLFVDDIFGKINSTRIYDFGTDIAVFPDAPDGLNGWYMTAPVINLSNSENSGIYYNWNGGSSFEYSNPFSLENNSLIPPERAGSLVLFYGANLTCGAESWKNRSFKIDLTAPNMTSTSPVNNSLLTCSYRPVISSVVSDVYSENSNIDPNSLSMSLDGVDVTAGMTKTAFGSYKFTTRYVPTADLAVGNHVVVLGGQDNAGNTFNQEWNFNIAAGTGFTSGVISPVDSRAYGSRWVLVNISSDIIIGEMKMKDTKDLSSTTRILCRNCSSYSKLTYFSEGWHNLSFNVVDSCGVAQETNSSILIDSVKPAAYSPFPSRNSATNGSKFSIKYTELNLVNITFVINGNETPTNCNLSGASKICEISFNISAFNSQYINYYFNITDPVRTIKSATTRVIADTSMPVLNVYSPIENYNYSRAYKGRIPINITLADDASLASLSYYDYNELLPRWRTICSKCYEYGNSRRLTLFFNYPEKWHNVTFVAKDLAGNSVSSQFNFFVS